jgi:hypothetical protein
MVDLDDSKAKTLRADPIQFKLFCAEKHLEEIPTSVPLDVYPQQKVMAEMIMESFLFYGVSALDIMFQEINKKLNLKIKPHKVTPNAIKSILK